MLRNWIRRILDEEIEDRLWQWEQELNSRVSKLLSDVSGMVQDSFVMDTGKEYTLLETETDKLERISGLIDLSSMKEGDVAELLLEVRYADGSFHQWSKQSIPKPPENLLQLDDMMAPYGAKVSLKNVAGRRFEVRFFLIRRH